MSPVKPFGIPYRTQRFKALNGTRPKSEDDDDGLSLAGFKCQEYLHRLIQRWPARLKDELPRLYLSRSGRVAILKKALIWRKSQEKDPFRKTKWTATEINTRIQNGGSLLPAIYEHLDHKDLREFLGPDLILQGKRGLRELAGKKESGEETLGDRIRQIREALRLNEVEEELLLFGFLSNTDPEAGLLREIVRNWSESKRHEKCPGSRDHLHPGVLATLLGYPRSDIEIALAPEAALLRIGLLNGDFEIESGVRDFIERGGGTSILEKHFRIYTGPTLSLESFTVSPNECEILVQLLNAHDGRHPLHVLLHGMEGAGKTEFGRSLAKATNRILFEVGGNVKESIEETWSGHRNAVIQYGMRALQMAANQAEGKRALAVLDEADLLLNDAEKGRINTMMDAIKIPVIWISNSLNSVERSTLRRFTYSVAFRKLGEVQRKGLWASILKKHNAEDLVPATCIDVLASRYPAAAGGIELAVQSTVALCSQNSGTPPERIMEGVLASHGRLMELESEEKGKTVRAPSYSLDGLNIKGGYTRIINTVRAFDNRWRDKVNSNEPCNLALLLYGPPGTGKTELARYLARDLCRPLHLKQTSDLLSKWVGGSEQLIKKAFDEAAEDEAILCLDEVEGLLRDRRGATKTWEITQVNTMLTQIENHRGLLVCSTNLLETLDEASRRRFHLKLEFGYLQGNGAKYFWDVFFGDLVAKPPSEAFFKILCSLPLLTPGDFKATFERLRYSDKSELSPESVMEELLSEIAHKDSRAGRSLGFGDH